MSWLSPPADGHAHVAPSLLAADFSCLDREVARMCGAGADLLHLDVMDGHFVPNLTFGPLVVGAVNGLTDRPLDAHLMLIRPDRFVQPFLAAGADAVTIHAECEADLPATLAAIGAGGARRGISLNPPTPLGLVLPLLDQVDLVLVMTVMPGFGGQSFDPSGLDKIRALAEARRQGAGEFLISVDGGINSETGSLCREAGADILVSGSWLFRHPDPSGGIRQLQGRDLE